MAGNFARRVAFSAVAIPCAGALIYLGGWPLAALLAVAGVLGVREIYDFAARLGVDPLRRTGMAAALAAPLGTYWAKGSEVHFAEPALYLLAVWLILVVTLAAWRRGPTGRPLAAAAVTVFGVAYAGVLPAFAIVLRHPSGVGPASWPGTALLFFPLVLTWAGDTAAYAGGSAIGGPKLAPTLSPKKTWAGAVSGFACTLLVAAGYAMWVLSPAGYPIGVGPALVMGAVISVVGQVGDVSESVFKREVGVKDSSALIPGHGGVLDRFDSLYFALPIAAFCYTLFGIPG
jgi:phosphatidate cytidylyltransferase